MALQPNLRIVCKSHNKNFMRPKVYSNIRNLTPSPLLHGAFVLLHLQCYCSSPLNTQCLHAALEKKDWLRCYASLSTFSRDLRLRVMLPTTLARFSTLLYQLANCLHENFFSPQFVMCSLKKKGRTGIDTDHEHLGFPPNLE